MKILKKYKKAVLFAVAILAVADLMSMAAPYYLKYIIPNIYKYLKITQDQYDVLNSLLGYGIIPAQFVGGWLCTRYSSRKMLSISLFITGALSIWWTRIIASTTIDPASAYNQLKIIYLGWAFSTSGLMWAQTFKLTSQLASKEDQAEMFGFQGALVGFFGLFFITLMGAWASKAGADGNHQPFYIFSYTLAATLIVSGFLAWKYVPEKPMEFTKGVGIAKAVKKALAPLFNIKVILMGVFVMGTYVFSSIFAYYMKSTLAKIGIAATVIATASGFRAYGIRTLISSKFGQWADKQKSYILLINILLAIGLAIASVFIFLPGWNGVFLAKSVVYKNIAMWAMFAVFIIAGFFTWFFVVLRYAQIAEIEVEPGQYGNIIAIVSVIAYSPDAWFYHMTSILGKNYIGADGGYTIEGLQIFLSIAVLTGIVGLICGIVLFRMATADMKRNGKTVYRWRELENS